MESKDSSDPKYVEPVIVAVDVMGTDRGPAEMIVGVEAALEHDPTLSCVLIGTAEALERHLAAPGPRLMGRVADEAIAMDEEPATAIRTKRGASTLQAMRMLRDGEAHVAVSGAGTGAVLLAAAAVLRRAPGVLHPALGTVVSSHLTEPSILVDCGASTERNSAWLEQFATFGRAMATALLDVHEPTVGLLANGTEGLKGDATIREAHARLLEAGDGYVGLVEPDGLFSSQPHVVVTDGLIGNLVLKSVEATWRAVEPLVDLSRAANPTHVHLQFANLGWGGVVLGVGGTVVKTHGTGSATNAFGAVLFAATAWRAQLHRRVAEAIARA